jgi:hypothetical protein
MPGQSVTATAEYVITGREREREREREKEEEEREREGGVSSYIILPKLSFIWFTHHNLKTQETITISIKQQLPPNFSCNISFNKLNTILRLPILID